MNGTGIDEMNEMNGIVRNEISNANRTVPSAI